MKPGCIIKLVVRAIDIITFPLPVIFGILLCFAATNKPVLTLEQYFALQQAVEQAQLAAAEGIGGRHAYIAMLLQQWGFGVAASTGWQVIRFAQRLLNKGWKKED